MSLSVLSKELLIILFYIIMDKMQIAELKWCKGESPEKSKKKPNENIVVDNNLNNVKSKSNNNIEEVEATLINRVNLGNVHQPPFVINNLHQLLEQLISALKPVTEISTENNQYVTKFVPSGVNNPYVTDLQNNRDYIIQ